MARAHTALLASLIITAALSASGCGTGILHAGDAGAGSATTTAPAHPGTTRTVPGGGDAGVSADAVKVIEAWSRALRRGDVRDAALYFRIPSLFSNGPGSVIVIHSMQDALAANEGLPCGATFVSATQRGPYVNALFRLTARQGPGGGSCSGAVGDTARTAFLIRDGRIVEWLRAPDAGAPNPSPGTSTAGGGPVI